MPTLPNIEDLGPRPIPQSNRQIAAVRNAGAVGEAVEGVGRAGAQAAVALGEIDQRRQASRAGVDFATMTGEIQQQVDEQRANAAPGGGGHLETVRAFTEQRTQQFIAGIRDRRVREQFETNVAQLRARTYASEDQWEIGQRRDLAQSNYEESGRLLENQLQTHPDASALQNYIDASASSLTGADAVSADLAEKLIRERRGRLAQAYVRGLTEQNPPAAQAVLQSGALNQWLGTDEAHALTGSADAAVRTQEADARRVAATAAAAARSQIDIFQRRLTSGDPTITEQDISHYGEIAHAANLTTDEFDLAKARVMFRTDQEFRNAGPTEISNEIHRLDTTIAQGRERIATPAQAPVQPVAPGNIDLASRPTVHNADGSVSTVRTISVETGQGEVLIPTVVGGAVVPDAEAIAHYQQTGENLGTFHNAAEATAYAQWLHQQEAHRVGADGAGLPDMVVRRDRLQTLLTQRTQQVQNDPLGAYAATGGVVAPLNPNDPASIRARVAAAQAARARFGFGSVLTQQETALMHEQVVNGGPAGRLSAVHTLASIGVYDQQAAINAAEQVAPNDPAFSYALRVPPYARELVIKGADARRLLPSSTTLADGSSSSVDAATQAWFNAHVAPSLVSSSPEFLNGALEASRNIYAELRRQSSTGGAGAEQFSEANFSSAVNLALGRTAHGGGLAAWGQGPRAADGNPHGFLLPTNMQQREFEQRMANLPLARTGGRWPAGAVNGAPTDGRGGTLSADTLRTQFVPVAVSDGVYQFHRGNVAVQAANGGPFQLDIRRIPPYRPNAAHAVAAATQPHPAPRMMPALPIGHSSGSPDPTLSPEQYRALHPGR